ncbi:DUF2344 domain-containing protein [bacterium]|nr:DUF2344 domain-containing protein [bacterium]
MQAKVRQRLRLRYAKDDVLMYIGQRDLLRYVIKLLRRSEIPFAVSGGFSPKPRLTFGPALPLGVQADNELLDVELSADLEWSAAEVAAARDRLADVSAPRDFVRELSACPTGAQPVNQLIAGARYRLVYGGDPAPVLAALNSDTPLAYNFKGKPRDLRQTISVVRGGQDMIEIDGAARPDENLNIIQLGRSLAELTGMKPLLHRRLALLDTDGAPL